MRKVIYGLTVSLDGYIETLDGDLNWTDPSPDLMEHMLERERGFDTHLYGRRLYENMTAHWPTADQNPNASKFEVAYARVWRQIRHVVFSRTLTQVSPGWELFRGDLAAWIGREKSLPGKDMVVGGANLAATFIAQDLIDEYRLYIQPIILGAGVPMFPRLDHRLKLHLVETQTFSGGVVMLRLAKNGSA